MLGPAMFEEKQNKAYPWQTRISVQDAKRQVQARWPLAYLERTRRGWRLVSDPHERMILSEVYGWWSGRAWKVAAIYMQRLQKEDTPDSSAT